MIGIERGSAAPRSVRVATVPLVVALALLGGCGSAEESSSVESPNSGQARAGGGEGGADRQGAVTTPARAEQGRDGAGRHNDDSPKGDGQRASSEAGSEEGDRAAAKRAASRSCPEGMTRDQCRAAAKEIARTAPSRTIESASDCVEAKGKSECEALAEELHEEEQRSGGSVNAEECVKHPTPHCEKVLGPILEAQYEAHQAGQ